MGSAEPPASRDNAAGFLRELPKEAYAGIIGFATFAGYVLTFAYESGFCHVYQIPIEMISLNLPIVLTVASGCGVALIASMYGYLAIETARKLGWPNAAPLIASCVLVTLLMVGICWWGFNFRGPALLYFGIVTLELIGTYFALREALGTRNPKLNALELTWLFTGFSVMIATIALAAYLEGMEQAVFLPQEVMRIQGDDYLVLRLYGDNVIAGRYAMMRSVEAKKDALALDGSLRVLRLGPNTAMDWKPRPANTVIVRLISRS